MEAVILFYGKWRRDWIALCGVAKPASWQHNRNPGERSEAEASSKRIPGPWHQ